MLERRAGFSASLIAPVVDVGLCVRVFMCARERVCGCVCVCACACVYVYQGYYVVDTSCDLIFCNRFIYRILVIYVLQ